MVKSNFLSSFPQKEKVHGYKHRYHFGEGGTERLEAAQFILEVFRRAEVPWDREIKPLRGWEERCG